MALLIEPQKWTQIIRFHALDLGFDAIGFSEASYLPEDDRRLSEWISKGMHGSMTWMERNHDKRVDPRKLVPGTQSVVSLLVSYHQAVSTKISSDQPQIAQYAQGRDYHKVVKKRMKSLFSRITDEIPQLQGRYFVDSAPVLERSWAQRSGLGWIGKNGNLLNRTHGSYFFLAELLINVPLVYDTPTTDHCGSCTQCIDACPTDAIIEPKKVDGSKCISHWNIEHKGEIPEKYHKAIGSWIFGCDICQIVCPWNQKALLGQWPELSKNTRLNEIDRDSFSEISLSDYEHYFNGSPVRRVKHEGFLRNARIVQKNLASK